MIYDTNVLIDVIRRGLTVSNRLVIPIIVVGELKSFALKSDWGVQKANRMNYLFANYPVADVTMRITEMHAQIDAFSQNKLQRNPLNSSARNMGKNDIWVAATALYLDMELHTSDNDFDHLPALGLQLVKY